MSQTLRLLLAQWQGGGNPNYAFGAELLNFLSPESTNSETIRVQVADNYDQELPVDNGLKAEGDLKQQIKETSQILDEKQPDRVIIYGGDCSIDYAPFDYLHGRYGNKLGVIWLDAHPDLVTLKDTNRAHETIVTDLLGLEETTLSQQLKHPFSNSQLLYAGLPAEELEEKYYLVDDLKIPVVNAEKLKESSQEITNWIKENNFEKIAIHFDLDVLDPHFFRSLLAAKPGTDPEKAGFPIGRLNFDQVIRFFKDVEEAADIVGLGVAEHMPWDAINLRNALNQISIFKD